MNTLPKIAFAHNVYDRFKTLKETIVIEKTLFPDAYVCVAYNNGLDNIYKDITNFSSVSFDQKLHKIGCVNGCILSIQQLLQEDFDILIFSHDDVRINLNFLRIFVGHVNDIINNRYDIICRMPEDFGDNYYMLETFYISKNVAIKVFGDLKTLNDESEIPLDVFKSISPEVWLYNLLIKSNLFINEIRFPIKIRNDEDQIKRDYNTILGKNLGYYHLNAGIRGWTD